MLMTIAINIIGIAVLAFYAILLNKVTKGKAFGRE